jgi:hypothetical protein
MIYVHWSILFALISAGAIFGFMVAAIIASGGRK